MCAGEGRGDGSQLRWTGLLPVGKGSVTATAHDRGLMLVMLTLIHHIGQCKLGTNATILIMICSHFVPCKQMLKAHSKGDQNPCLVNKVFPVAVTQVVQFILFPCISAS